MDRRLRMFDCTMRYVRLLALGQEITIFCAPASVAGGRPGARSRSADPGFLLHGGRARDRSQH